MLSQLPAIKGVQLQIQGTQLGPQVGRHLDDVSVVWKHVLPPESAVVAETYEVKHIKNLLAV
jgi:hypothetical protein